MATDDFLRPDQILNRIYNSGSVQVIFREDEILNSTFSEDDDALKISIGGGNVPIPSGSINADGVVYDPTNSSLQSDNVNDAIDELDHNISTIINSGSVTTYIETMSGTKIATGNFKNTLFGDSDVSGSLHVYNDFRFDGNLIGIVNDIETVGGTKVETGEFVTTLHGNSIVSGSLTVYDDVTVSGTLNASLPSIEFESGTSFQTGLGQSIHTGNMTVVGTLLTSTAILSPIMATDTFSDGFGVSGSVNVSGSVIAKTIETDYADYSIGTEYPHKEGRMYYSFESKSFIGYNDQSSVKQQLGQEVWFRVYNNTGITIPNGKVVGPLGQFAGVPSIGLANAHIKEQSRLVGVTTMDIPNNSYGYVTKLGAVGGMDTSMFQLGDILYLSDTTSGELTLNRPTDGSYVVIIGSVSNVGTTDGAIVVDIVVSDLTVEVTDTNGFPDDQRTKTSLAVNNGTRTFTISSNDGQFHYYEIGEKYEQYGDDSIVFSDQEGEHWFYYEEGILLTEFDPSYARKIHIILNHAFISSVYWNADDKNVVIDIQDERHSIGMSPSTHLNLHLTRGAQWVSGYGLDNFDADGDGDDDSAAQFSVSTGVFFDEDISHTESGIPIGSTIPVIYNDGATGNIRQDSIAGFAVLSNPAGRLYYNEWTGTTWKLSEVPDRDACLYHIFSFNGQDVNTISVMGQNAYNSVNDARNGAATEISNLISQLPFAEMIPIASIVFESRNSYDNQVSARIRTVDGQNYVDWRVTELSQGSAPTSHANLTNVNQAGIGILDGHISDQVQSIDGEKIFLQTLTIEKDLIVNGKRIIQNVDETLITDNIVVLNSGEQGAGITAGVTGVMFDRGTQTNYAYIYEESSNLFKLGEYQNLNGTVVSATSISITLDSTASSNDDEYNGKIIKIYTDGGVPAQFRTIIDYVGSTKTATVANWTTLPDISWEYEIQGIINNTQRITTGPNSIVDGGYFVGNTATNSHVYNTSAQTAIDLNYWTLIDNAHINFSGGRVSVGGTDPSAELNVVGLIQASENMHIKSPTGAGALATGVFSLQDSTGATQFYVGSPTTGNSDLYLYSGTVGSIRAVTENGGIFIKNTNGFTGFLNTDPQSAVDVTGDAIIRGTLSVLGAGNSYILGNFGIGTSNPTTKFEIVSNELLNFATTTTHSVTGGHSIYQCYNNGSLTQGLGIYGGFGTENDIDFWVDGKFYIKGNGNIGIGTTTPTLAKLQIDGNIYASSGITSGGTVTATGLSISGTSGVSGTFTSNDGKTITVNSGIITAIV